MDYRSLKRSSEDTESVGSSDGPKRIRTGIARWRHTLFRPLTDTQNQAKQTKLDLELRLGSSQVDSHETSQASSNYQPFRWQEQQNAFSRWEPKASHATQPHQETRPFPQQEVIGEQMLVEIPSASDSKPNHARPLSIQETDHERIHCQAGSSNLLTRDFLTQPAQIPWEQATLPQQHEVHDQAGPSRQADALPACTNKIEQLVAKLSESYGKNEN